MDATDRGVSLGEAAKSALKPTLRAVVDAGAGQMASFQGGKGGKKRLAEPSFYERMQDAKRRKKHGKKSRKTKKVEQSGEGKKKRKAKQSGEGKRTRKAKQSGKGKLSKKRVYKKSVGSDNF